MNLDKLKKLMNCKSEKWFDFIDAKKDDEPAEIRIDGVIGGDWFCEESVSTKDFVTKFNSIKQNKVNIHINSPGGSVYDGFSIYSVISASNKHVTVIIDGLAASIASVIAMSGDEIEMPESSYMMVHNPWCMMAGNAKNLRAEADTLDSLSGKINKVLADRSGQKAEKISELMDGQDGADGTFIDAQTALSLGLATKIIENKKAAACIGTDLFDNLPQTLSKLSSSHTKRQLEQSLRDAGYSAADAKAIVSGGFKPRDAEPEDNGGCPESFITILHNFNQEQKGS